MELRVLRYFLAVAREQTILGAAETLHVTQPTLSRQLMELERELGRQLFIRGGRKLTLTEDGMFLRKRAQELVDLADKTEAAFQDANELVSGDVYIGAGETDAMRILARAVKSIRADYPDIRFHLFSGNAESVMERLDKGLLDFGVLIEPADIRKYDYLQLPAVDTWGLLMRKDSPLASKETIAPGDLWGLPLFCSRQMLDGNGISGWLGNDTNKLNIIGSYNLIFNAALMVEEGLGYALTLDKLARTGPDSPLCFKPLSPPLTVNLDLVWKKYQVFSKAAEAFLRRLQEAPRPGTQV